MRRCRPLVLAAFASRRPAATAWAASSSRAESTKLSRSWPMVARTDRRSSSMSEDIGGSHKLVIRLLSRALLMGFTRPQTGLTFALPPGGDHREIGLKGALRRRSAGTPQVRGAVPGRLQRSHGRIGKRNPPRSHSCGPTAMPSKPLLLCSELSCCGQQLRN